MRRTEKAGVPGVLCNVRVFSRGEAEVKEESPLSCTGHFTINKMRPKVYHRSIACVTLLFLHHARSLPSTQSRTMKRLWPSPLTKALPRPTRPAVDSSLCTLLHRPSPRLLILPPRSRPLHHHPSQQPPSFPTPTRRPQSRTSTTLFTMTPSVYHRAASPGDCHYSNAAPSVVGMPSFAFAFE